MTECVSLVILLSFPIIHWSSFSVWSLRRRLKSWPANSHSPQTLGFTIWKSKLFRYVISILKGTILETSSFLYLFYYFHYLKMVVYASLLLQILADVEEIFGEPIFIIDWEADLGVIYFCLNFLSKFMRISRSIFFLNLPIR